MSPIKCIRSLLLALAGMALLLPLAVRGADPNLPAAHEIPLLPAYCKYTQGFRGSVPGGNDPEKIKYWRSTMGLGVSGYPLFEDMHHYCFALAQMNRVFIPARTLSPMERNKELTNAIDNFNYVLRHAPQDFVLLPEILTNKGRTLILSGRPADGVGEMQRAIELKPDYWPPYAYLSDYYKNTGNIKKARDLLERALSFSPNAKGLQMRMTELDAFKDKRKAAPQPTR